MTSDKDNKIKPKIAPAITVTVEQSFNGNYELVALDSNGNEKPGTEFSISAKGFAKLYQAQTEGHTQGVAKFKIKKNPTI
jgi:hypothetical protein